MNSKAAIHILKNTKAIIYASHGNLDACSVASGYIFKFNLVFLSSLEF